MKVKNSIKHSVFSNRLCRLFDFFFSTDKIGFQNKSSNYYIIAKKHVWYLAQDIYEKMHYVDKKGWKNIELVGHGMGAHAAGMAARFFHRNTKYVIDKIIGTG